MKYKPDWQDAKQRLTALWHGEMLDRPCIAVRAPAEPGNTPPAPEPPSAEAKWLDPDYVTAAAIHELETTWWGGEMVPSYLLMGGWVVSLGGTPRFSDETIWFDPRDDVDFSQPSPFRHDPDDPWVPKHDAALRALCDAAGREDFLVGSPCILPANDLLSMHLGTGTFLTAMKDHPDWIAEAIVRGAEDLSAVRKELESRVRERHAYWYGVPGWMPFWAPEPFTSTQSDVSCMVSPEMYDRFILPEIEIYGREYGAMWYHLDGGDARRHLPRLLSLPFVRVVQYGPDPSEPPNGPEHLDLYRRIQEAGRIVHLLLPAENIEPLVRQLDPGLLMLQAEVDSPEQGARLLADAGRWARRRSTAV